RIFWLLLTLGLFALSGYQGYYLISDYLKRPTITQIQVVSKSDLTFPAITICNMNRLRRSALPGTRFEGLLEVDGGIEGGDYDYSWWFDWSYDTSYSSSSSNYSSSSSNYSSSSSSSSSSLSSSSSSSLSSYHNLFDWYDNYYYDSDFTFEYDHYYDWGDVTDENDWQGFYDNSKADDFSDILEVTRLTKEELRDLGHNAEDLIIQCTFDKRSCNYTEFHKFQNKHYGNCYTFNHDVNTDFYPLRKTSKSGAQYGLHLTLFLEQPEYVGILSPETGVRISIHPSDIKPFPEDDGITANPGTATSIGIRQTAISRLPEPYGNCTVDGSDSQYRSSSFNYSTAACIKSCVQQELYGKCGCVTDILIEADQCSVLDQKQQICRQLVEQLYEEDELECNCPLSCTDTTYAISTSTSLWPSERYEEHLYSRLLTTNLNAARMLTNIETSRKNLVRLRLYFEELNLEKLDQIPLYTIENLLGGVGGLLGLYIGVSAMTITEFIIFFWNLIAMTCKKSVCKNSIEPA
ncbi:epithelial sodium channel subunit beta-like, partial [Antedon mediterranea]|uniref:epithelial sodium channel subunit beta-like n=1 Tax=Antedon mediterranea TaxID=105859 RepID=UPI003AF77A0A